eukprot:757202-Hanusia_phi.AAC.1
MELEECVHRHERQHQINLHRIKELESELYIYRMKPGKAQHWLRLSGQRSDGATETRNLPVPPKRFNEEDFSFIAFSNSKKMLMGYLDPNLVDHSRLLSSDGWAATWAADEGSDRFSPQGIAYCKRCAGGEQFSTGAEPEPEHALVSQSLHAAWAPGGSQSQGQRSHLIVDYIMSPGC